MESRQGSLSAPLIHFLVNPVTPWTETGMPDHGAIQGERRQSLLMGSKQSVGQPWWGGTFPQLSPASSVTESLISCHGAHSPSHLRITTASNLPRSKEANSLLA